MHFLIDADLPRSIKSVLEKMGHAAVDARDIGLGDAEDAIIAARAKADRRCLLTGDFGFADVRNYPPAEYPGIVVIELPKDATARVILALVEGLITQAEVLAKLPGRLAIVSTGRVRLRPK